jgi:hypothetical protein
MPQKLLSEENKYEYFQVFTPCISKNFEPASKKVADTRLNYELSYGNYESSKSTFIIFLFLIFPELITSAACGKKKLKPRQTGVFL